MFTKSFYFNRILQQICNDLVIKNIQFLVIFHWQVNAKKSAHTNMVWAENNKTAV